MASLEELRDEIVRAINRHCAEDGSDTPDFILADYLMGCMQTFDRAVDAREKWYGRPVRPVAETDKKPGKK